MREQDHDISANIYSHINDMHVLQKAYFMPIQILLRKLPPYERTSPLPQGLMIAQKKSINDTTYTPIRLEDNELRPENKLSKQKHRRNLINLMKKANMRNADNNRNRNQPAERMVSYIRQRRSNLNTSLPIQIAICVCVYSEDAQMLQQTISYIKQNVISLVKNGARQDSIGVFIFFDGIEKMDSSVIEYFNKIQNQQINYQDQTNLYAASNDFRRTSNIIQSRNYNSQQKKEVETKLFNRYLPRIIFSEEELADRKERTLLEVHRQYMEMVTLKDKIQKLKAQPSITYQKLPDKVREEFTEIVRKSHPYEDQEQHQIILFQLLYKDKQGQKAICQQALASTQAFCNKYLNSKSDLAYLSMRRQRIYGKEQIERQIQQALLQNSRRPPRVINFRNEISEEIYRQSSEEQLLDDYVDKKIYMNLFYCVKYKNQGKLSSHNWFFNGFCKELNPKYVILVDVGLKARANSIFAMYHHLKKNSNLGGVCGYMSLKIEQMKAQDEVNEEEVDCLTDIAHSFTSIQRAQQVQYHFAHLLDKPFQSLFNFIHVLPGAFSGYNMLAIHSPDDHQELVLVKYFQSLNQKVVQKPIVQTKITLSWLAAKVLLPDFINSCCLKVDPNSQQQLLCNQNMNLAEDRILCFGIHKNGFDLAYLPDSFSEVDPINNLHSLFGQRKRWINGSYFAFEKVKEEFSQFREQNNKSQFCLWLQMLYLSLVNLVSFFSVSLFLFTFQISMRAFYEDVLKPVFDKTFVTKQVIPFFINTMSFIYVFFILTMIYFSLNVTYNDRKFKKLIYLSSTIMGIFSIIVTTVLVVDLVRSDWSNSPFIQINGVDSKQTVTTQKPWEQKLAFWLRIIIISMFGLHGLPVICHALFYCKFQIIVEIVLGIISFLFYNPTYLIILNIYALCRMDDISWGTKGRDQQQKFKETLKKKWRMIKFVHVFKYLFWNTALSLLFLNIQFEYTSRIIITLCIMGIITFILFTKMLLGLIYSIKYRFCILLKIEIETLLDRFQFKSEISDYISQQRTKLLSRATLSTNITSLTKNPMEGRERALNRPQ